MARSRRRQEPDESTQAPNARGPLTRSRRRFEQSASQDSLSNKVKWQCHQCRASFDDKADLTAHVLSHRQPPLTSPSDANTVANPPTPPPPIACSECDEMFMFEFRLKAHMLSAHGPVKRKSRSVVVPREEQVQKVGLPPEEGQPKVPSSSESLIVIGKRTRVQETVVRSQHSTCLTISAAEALESMKEDVSKNQDAPPETVMAAGFQPYRCKTCGKQFQRHGHLTVHQRSHSGVRPYQCKSCGLSFSSNSALKNHQISHTGVKDYMCNICKNSFARKSYLKTHLATVHDGSRPHTCRVCLKSFKGQGHLTEHMRLHNQEKPFQCNFCPQAFVQRSHLTVHLRVHSGAKPYACKICLQRFAHSSAVKIHERQHSGARPFPCPRCSSRFSQLPHLKKHMKCIHGEDRLYQCEVCNQSFRKRVDLENHVASNCDQTQPSQTPADQKKLVRVMSEPKKPSKTKKKAMSASAKMHFTGDLLQDYRILVEKLLLVLDSERSLVSFGFGKLPVEIVLFRCLQEAGECPVQDESNPLKAFETNIRILLEWTLPRDMVQEFEGMSVKDIMLFLVSSDSPQALSKVGQEATS